MKRQFMMGVVALTLVFISAQPARSQPRTADPIGPTLAAPQGFGDRQNSTPWAMTWWKGQLYVGTNRSMACVQDATLVYYNQFGAHYPTADPDIACTPSPQDLPLQAEIWRWTPTTNVWERVFQSPNDVPIPGATGKFVARDTGFRSITAFTEADGSEALYIGGTSSRSFNGPSLPPPRILRSTDGRNWTPLPQDPGTFMGNTPANGFRSMTIYNGKMYLVASSGLLGNGPVYVAANPAGGNNNFQQFTPGSMLPIFEMATFNGFLYLGSATQVVTGTPFWVWKTTGTQTFTPVVTNGGYVKSPSPTPYPFCLTIPPSALPSTSVVSMHEYGGMLYFGTEAPSDVYRIHADDSWELVVGSPGTGPNGPIQPLSGIGTGYNWFENVHIWRMGVSGNKLYVGTYDESTTYRNNTNPNCPYQTAAYQAQMGFDLYSAPDGVHFQPVTTTGFGDKFNFGVRQIVPTPYGLFIGAVNPYYGLTIWQFPAEQMLYLPAIIGGGGSQ